MSQSTHTLLILESKPFFEHDKRCIGFSKETGKLTCLAKYAAKPSKKKIWSLEPLTIASVTLFKGKSFQLITNYSVIHHYQTIRSSFNHLQYALFFIHIIKKCITEEQSNIPLFNLAQQTLTLCNKLKPIHDIKLFFYKAFSQIEGIYHQETLKQENQYLHDIENYLGYKLNLPLQLDERSKTLVK
tara:strand:+ start:1146 stop:1703 length:558 start_codon:yes stop_codon:yes gene_type:complete